MLSDDAVCLSAVLQTPKAPSSPKRKTYERSFPGSAPKRALLEYPVTGEAVMDVQVQGLAAA
jgi:hypothetical protein